MSTNWIQESRERDQYCQNKTIYGVLAHYLPPFLGEVAVKRSVGLNRGQRLELNTCPCLYLPWTSDCGSGNTAAISLFLGNFMSGINLARFDNRKASRPIREDSWKYFAHNFFSA